MACGGSPMRAGRLPAGCSRASRPRPARAALGQSCRPAMRPRCGMRAQPRGGCAGNRRSHLRHIARRAMARPAWKASAGAGTRAASGSTTTAGRASPSGDRPPQRYVHLYGSHDGRTCPRTRPRAWTRHAGIGHTGRPGPRNACITTHLLWSAPGAPTPMLPGGKGAGGVERHLCRDTRCRRRNPSSHARARTLSWRLGHGSPAATAMYEQAPHVHPPVRVPQQARRALRPSTP